MRFGLITLISFALTNSWAADVTSRPAFAYSKLIGGSGSDIGMAVATDSAGNVYVAGTTTSLDFPLVNAFQRRIGGVPVRATADGGKNWTMPGLPDPVYTVAGSSKAPATVYAGTTNALYKSVDSGKTWAIQPAFGSASVNALWVDSEAPSIVHAATNRGMLKSDDEGATWKAPPSGAGNVLALAAHPSKPARLFAAMDIGTRPARASLYRTTDSGATWTILPNSPYGPITLATDASNPDVLYAGVATSGFVSGSATALYKSLDGGDTWTKVSQPRLAISTFAIASGTGYVLAATLDGVLRSVDGGATWTATALTSSAGAVAVDPTRGQAAYASTATGVFASADGGATWVSILRVRQLVETIAVAPTSPPTLYIGGATGRNVFVTKWSGDGKELVYATYLGGSYYDYATGIAVDRQGNAYVTGYTYSTDFPVTAGASQARNAGNFNAFLSKIGPNGDTLLYSTYLGGSTADAAFAIALDSAANVYLTGYAGSPDFPVTPGAPQTRLQQGCPAVPGVSPLYSSGDAFVAKLSTGGEGLRYASFLGGTCADEGIGIAVDSQGNAYVAGATTSADFPVTKGALQQAFRGGSTTGFLVRISSQGTTLDYATYLGGGSGDSALAVAVDAKGAAYVTGSTWGFDQPVYVTFASAGSNPSLNYPQVGFSAPIPGAAFVAKIDPTGAIRQYLKYLGGTGGAGTGISLDPSGNAWVTGIAYSDISAELFPTVHPFQAKYGTAFVSQLAPDGSTLLFSSYVEAARQAALDSSGNVFLVSYTYSNPAKPASPTALLVRIDGAVSTAVTLEEPLRIVKGSSFFVDRGVAPGEIVTMTGNGLGPAEEVGARSEPGGKIATSLAGTTVTFDGVAAPLLSVQARKIVCIVPFSLRYPGFTTVQAQAGGSASNSIKLPVWSNSIEILAAINENGSINSSEHRAAPGSIVTFYGAGFGQTVPGSDDGQINGTAVPKFTAGTIGATVADQRAQVLYAGPAPGQVAGIVQVNVRISQVPAGSYTAVLAWDPVSAADYYGNGVTLWVGQQ
jgi:uncharacterized protein (TIGR03437 family)